MSVVVCSVFIFILLNIIDIHEGIIQIIFSQRKGARIRSPKAFNKL